MKTYTVLCVLISLTLLKAELSCNEFTDPDEYEICSQRLRDWRSIKKTYYEQCCEAVNGQRDLCDKCEEEAQNNATQSLNEMVADNELTLGNKCNTLNGKCIPRKNNPNECGLVDKFQLKFSTKANNERK
ncbi:uncharacterized protein LOC117565105 [Drosophila albomicans]|uniref:Uncharacterized protein LOC117565105 n=1 Tax=Drosophila albomicans TaxID=7291 RepID=A0A6P8W8Y5_DROAB|nr:uncharacterized protein LOC117565105 [Drosophila albomicans]